MASRRPVLKLLSGGLAGALGLRSFAAAAATRYPDTPEQVLADPQWPESWPFREDSFQRYDENSDTSFYSMPRFVTHIDDAAIAALTDYYNEVFPPSGQKDTALLVRFCSLFDILLRRGDRILNMSEILRLLRRHKDIDPRSAVMRLNHVLLLYRTFALPGSPITQRATLLNASQAWA